MDDSLPVVEEAAGCRCQASVRSVNQRIDVGTLLLSQAFLCVPAHVHPLNIYRLI